MTLRSLPLLLILAVPLMARAQSSAPVIVFGEDAPPASAAPVPGAGLPNFPENALTRLGENTTGQHVDAPATPASPTASENPPAPASPAAAATPSSPTPPANPVDKLWPRNTVEIFLPPCTGLRPQYVLPCTCVITKLMLAMPHDEFLKKSADGSIEQDARLQQIRTECATTPAKKE